MVPAPTGAFVVRAQRWATAEAVLGTVACWRCRGTGLTSCTSSDTAPRFARCRCQRPLDQARAFNAANVPGRYAQYQLEAWPPNAQRGALEQVYQWAERVESSSELVSLPTLVLTGPPGVGKTHLAVGLLRRLILEGRRPGLPLSGRFLEPTQLIHGYKVDGTPLNLGKLLEADVVVLDDLVAPRTPFERSVIDEIVTRRYQRGGPFIVTTNLAAREFAGALGERVASRLGAGTLLCIVGPDQRRTERGTGRSAERSA